MWDGRKTCRGAVGMKKDTYGEVGQAGIHSPVQLAHHDYLKLTIGETIAFKLQMAIV